MNQSICNMLFRWIACAAVLHFGVDTTLAQEWLHPDNVQPLPQYQPSQPARYPLIDDPGSIPDTAANVENTIPRSNLSGDRLAPNPLKSGELSSSLGTSSAGSDFKPLPSPASQESNSKKFNPPSSAVRPLPPTPPKVEKQKKSPGSKADQTKAKKDQAKSKKDAEKEPAAPYLTYDIYRDRNVYPIDPRKPNSPCTAGASCSCSRSGRKIPGLHGRPYQEKEPGACQCGDRKFAMKHPHFSVYWPRPFSANMDDRHPERAAERYQPCQKKRIVDAFDHLANFKLVNYSRKDNGHCGTNADPYGCLGESNQLNSMVTSIPAEVHDSYGLGFQETEPNWSQEPVYSQPVMSQEFVPNQIPMQYPTLDRYPIR